MFYLRYFCRTCKPQAAARNVGWVKEYARMCLCICECDKSRVSSELMVYRFSWTDVLFCWSSESFFFSYRSTSLPTATAKIFGMFWEQDLAAQPEWTKQKMCIRFSIKCSVCVGGSLSYYGSIEQRSFLLCSKSKAVSIWTSINLLLCVARGWHLDKFTTRTNIKYSICVLHVW